MLKFGSEVKYRKCCFIGRKKKKTKFKLVQKRPKIYDHEGVEAEKNAQCICETICTTATAATFH